MKIKRPKIKPFQYTGRGKKSGGRFFCGLLALVGLFCILLSCCQLLDYRFLSEGFTRLGGYLTALFFLIIGIVPIGYFFSTRVSKRQAKKRSFILKSINTSWIALIALFILLIPLIYLLIQSTESTTSFTQNPIVILCTLLLLLVCYGIVFHLLKLTNAHPVITVSPGDIRPGTTLTIHNRMRGEYRKLSHLKVELICVKDFTKTRTRFDHEKFKTVTESYTEAVTMFHQSLIDTTDHSQMNNIAFEAELPKGVFPSSSKIRWYIEVNGRIPRRPDIKKRFKFFVYPNY